MATLFSNQPVAGDKEKPDYLGSSRVSLGQSTQACESRYPGNGEGGAKVVLEAG